MRIPRYIFLLAISIVFLSCFDVFGVDKNGNYDIHIHNETSEAIEVFYWRYVGNPSYKSYEVSPVGPNSVEIIKVAGTMNDDDFVEVKYLGVTRKYSFDPNLWRWDHIIVKESDFQ